jgi:hypothetical protein
MRASTLPYQCGVPEANSQDVQCYVMLEPHHISEFKPRLPVAVVEPSRTNRKAAVAVAMRDQIGTLDHQQVVALKDGTGPFASNVHSAVAATMASTFSVDRSLSGFSLPAGSLRTLTFDAHQVAIGLPPC